MAVYRLGIPQKEGSSGATDPAGRKRTGSEPGTYTAGRFGDFPHQRRQSVGAFAPVPQEGETRPFQLVPGVPFRGKEFTFSRLVCFPGESQGPVQFFVEEYSGSPRDPGRYGRTAEVSLGEAESVLRNWVRGKVPSVNGWMLMERTDHGWQRALEHQ